MKILKQVGHQGDVQFYSIDSLPKGLKSVKHQFIAQSEKTGHVHALCGDYDMYEHKDGFVVDVKQDCILNHTDKQLLFGENWNDPKVLPSKDHNPSTIKKGLYFIGIQRRFNPLEKIMEKVTD